MKKFFGIILIIAGAIWAIGGLMAFNAESGTDIFASIFVVVLGIVPLIFGIKLVRNKSKNSNHVDSIQPSQDPAMSQQKSTPEQSTISLQQIRELVAQKLNNIKSTNGFRIPAHELKQMFHGLNDTRLPFSFQETKGNNADMIAHWKLSDAEYLGMLGLNKYKQQDEFDILLKFDEQNGELRCKDKLLSKQSSFGFGGMGMEVSTFKGKATSKKKEIVIGRKKDGSIGKVVDINLDTTILQNAINDIAQKCGWKVKRVTGRL